MISIGYLVNLQRGRGSMLDQGASTLGENNKIIILVRFRDIMHHIRLQSASSLSTSPNLSLLIPLDPLPQHLQPCLYNTKPVVTSVRVYTCHLDTCTLERSPGL